MKEKLRLRTIIGGIIFVSSVKILGGTRLLTGARYSSSLMIRIGGELIKISLSLRLTDMILNDLDRLLGTASPAKAFFDAYLKNFEKEVID